MAATTYPVATIAKLLLLTERHVQRLTADGVIPRAEHGRYELAPTVQGYIRYLRDRTLGADAEGAESAGSYRTQLLKARARAATAEADRLDGILVESAQVEAAWARMVLNMRTRLLSLPSEAAARVNAARSLPQVQAVLEQLVSEALDQLSTQPVEAVPAGGEPDADRDGAAGPGAGGGAAAAELERMG